VSHATVTLDPPLPARLGVGGGTSLLVRGALLTTEPPARVWLSVDGTDIPLRARVPDQAGRGERFWAFADVPGRRARGHMSLALHIRPRAGHDFWEPLGDVALEPDPPQAPVALRSEGGGPWVALCLATYRPDPSLLRRQVESLRAQSHREWIAIVSDDGSSARQRAEIERAIEGDPRFHLLPAAPHMGLYANFERAVRAVPAWAHAVAFCDQDDRWHPGKLATTLARLDGGRPLVCCDARVVDAGGRLLSPTLWPRMRRRTDLASLLVANAVPGCMSLWDARLLETVLPFPRGAAELFHDQWVACVAAAEGGIERLAEPLLDYVQHGGNAFGHGRTIDRSTGRIPLRALRGAARDRSQRRALAAAQIDAVLRAELFARTLTLRGVAGDRRARVALRDFAGEGRVARRIAGHATRAARAGVERGLPGVEVTAARGVAVAALGPRMRGWVA
jgi:hypothetical protein